MSSSDTTRCLRCNTPMARESYSPDTLLAMPGLPEDLKPHVRERRAFAWSCPTCRSTGRDYQQIVFPDGVQYRFDTEANDYYQIRRPLAQCPHCHAQLEVVAYNQDIVLDEMTRNHQDLASPRTLTFYRCRGTEHGRHAATADVAEFADGTIYVWDTNEGRRWRRFVPASPARATTEQPVSSSNPQRRSLSSRTTPPCPHGDTHTRTVANRTITRTGLTEAQLRRWVDAVIVSCSACADNGRPQFYAYWDAGTPQEVILEFSGGRWRLNTRSPNQDIRDVQTTLTPPPTPSPTPARTPPPQGELRQRNCPWCQHRLNYNTTPSQHSELPITLRNHSYFSCTNSHTNHEGACFIYESQEPTASPTWVLSSARFGDFLWHRYLANPTPTPATTTAPAARTTPLPTPTRVAPRCPVCNSRMELTPITLNENQFPQAYRQRVAQTNYIGCTCNHCAEHMGERMVSFVAFNDGSIWGYFERVYTMVKLPTAERPTREDNMRIIAEYIVSHHLQAQFNTALVTAQAVLATRTTPTRATTPTTGRLRLSPNRPTQDNHDP